MVVLFLCFFVLLLSFARTDTANFDSALGSVRQALGAQPTQVHAPHPQSERAALTPSPSPGSTQATRDQAVVERLTRFLAARGLSAQVEVAPSERGIVLRTRDQILFDSGAAELKPRGLPVLAAVCELARHFRGQLAVEGHTDDRPMQSALFPSNWELSGARSAVVLRYLLAEQIQPELLHMAGYAERRPIASNETEEGRAKNRRVEFVFEYERGANPEALFEF
jgi:chemotaxis protein MotB